jgi:adenylate cyclase
MRAMSRVGWAATVGVATGIVGLVFAALPFVAALEDSIGLRWLFRMRGAIPPPAGVAVVSIDEWSGPALGLPSRLRDWPRSRHAQLIERLVDEGTSVIAFDVQFFEHREADADRVFAEAIARARRVVLVQRVERVTAGAYEWWERQDPVPALVAGSLGLAPPPLPDASNVSWVPLFLDTPDFGALPSLAAVALQVHAMPALGRFVDLLTTAGVEGLEPLPRGASEIASLADLLRLMQVLRRELPARRQVLSRAVGAVVAHGERDPAAAQALLALVDLYTGSTARYLNFYGPPGTLCTMAYEVALGEVDGPRPCSLDGAVVFVGMGSARLGRAGQFDTYRTAYGDRDGIDFSGVEIHATAFANLLTGTTLRSPGTAGTLALLMGIGALLGGGSYWRRTRRRSRKGAAGSRVEGAAFAIAAAAGYGMMAYAGFRQYQLALPLLVPIAVQLPAALILSLLAPPARHEEQIRAVCLAADASGSTALGQRLTHGRYAAVMAAYHETLAQVVRRWGGEIVPPEGDGFVALWCAASGGRHDEAEAAMRRAACLAALDLAEVAEAFNQHQPEGERLPIRVGIHVGVVTIHSDADRGVFRVLGDTVNIASRLCDLNAALGTQVLAAHEVVKGLEGAPAWRIVESCLPIKGVTHPPAIVELRHRHPRLPSLPGPSRRQSSPLPMP